MVNTQGHPLFPGPVLLIAWWDGMAADGRRTGYAKSVLMNIPGSGLTAPRLRPERHICTLGHTATMETLLISTSTWTHTLYIKMNSGFQWKTFISLYTKRGRQLPDLTPDTTVFLNAIIGEQNRTEPINPILGLSNDFMISRVNGG